VLGGKQIAPSLAARRAYGTLVVKLGLTAGPAKYDRD
jgi:hypothetical protein